MTPQEAQMLQDLVQKVQGTELTEKDPDAEALLEDGLARDPDAIYKLAQTVLIQNLALQQANAQIQQLRQQPALQQPAKATSFLGGLLHRNAPPAQPAYSQGQPSYQQVPPQYTQAPPQYAAAPPAYGQPVYGQPAPGGGSGFLRSAATTAAGVAGGMLAFEGVESLIHGFEHGGYGGGYEGGGWGGGMGYPGGGAPEETVINNYYDSPQGQDAYGANGPDEQPQGPYDASADANGPDEQPQGPYDDSGDDSNYDSGDDQSYVDDSGGDNFS